MTLDEAIKHCEERANQDCTDCAKEHRQLAEWLKELMQYRENDTKQETEIQRRCKMRLFISQPMSDKTDEEIKKERRKIIKEVQETYGDIEVIDSFFEGAPHHVAPLWFLGKSFELLSTADLVYFAEGWNKYRGCKMEYVACLAYGLHIIKK